MTVATSAKNSGMEMFPSLSMSPSFSSAAACVVSRPSEVRAKMSSSESMRPEPSRSIDSKHFCSVSRRNLVKYIRGRGAAFFGSRFRSHSCIAASRTSTLASFFV